MGRLVPEDISTWKKGWVYDRTHQEKQQRELLRWMDSVLGITEKYDLWNSYP